MTPKISNSPRDWPEDFGKENGEYMCRCTYCESVFMGHKRRVVCKICHGVYRVGVRHGLGLAAALFPDNADAPNWHKHAAWRIRDEREKI